MLKKTYGLPRRKPTYVYAIDTLPMSRFEIHLEMYNDLDLKFIYYQSHSLDQCLPSAFWRNRCYKIIEVRGRRIYFGITFPYLTIKFCL